MKRQAFLSALLMGALIGAIAVFAIVQAVGGGDGDGSDGGGLSAQASPTPAATQNGQASLSTDCLSAADIYAMARPAVVQITSSGTAGPFDTPSGGTGSGIVMDTDGTVLTNYHVVSGADTLEVRFVDGDTAPAELIGSDPANDLALLRVDDPGRAFVAATLGDSDALRVGDPVLAIGNPFNLEGTLTQGIVSALDRTFAVNGNTRPIRNMIQTDAPVNPGNSGGPLLNFRGEVVGVNTLIENPTGDNVNVGIAFAVSAATAQRSLPEMLSGATVSHPWLGIGGSEVTPALSADLDLGTDSGVYVTVVADGSPADEVGLRGAFSSEAAAAQTDNLPPGGDVILAADGQAVASVDELAEYLDREKAPGDSVELRILRDGEEQTVTATLDEWPA